jgi:hypothetical protein
MRHFELISTFPLSRLDSTVTAKHIGIMLKSVREFDVSIGQYHWKSNSLTHPIDEHTADQKLVPQSF